MLAGLAQKLDSNLKKSSHWRHLGQRCSPIKRQEASLPTPFAAALARRPQPQGLELLAKALDLDASLESAHLMRGRALAELGRTDEAIAVWQAVRAVNPDCRQATELLGEREVESDPPR